MGIVKYKHSSSPDILYKFCRKEICDAHLSKGWFRFGNSAVYRREYNHKGSGFGDPEECGQKFVWPDGTEAFSISDWHLLCLSTKYSKAAHLKWFRRQDCKYDYCVPLNALALEQALSASLGSDANIRRLVSCGGVTYDKATIYSNYQVWGDERRDVFSKRSSYGWEKEYRFATPITVANGEDPLDISIEKFSSVLLPGIEVPKLSK